MINHCFFASAVVVLVLAQPAFAQVGDCMDSVDEAYLDIANVRARILNNGGLFWRGGGRVYEVPKDDGVSPIFTAALWVAGRVDGELRITSTRYGPYEFWAGPLDEAGNPPDDCFPFDKIWKVNATDVTDYEVTGLATPDLAGWPTGLGAPTLAPSADDGEDNDGDGVVDEDGEVKEIQEGILQQPLADRIGRVIDLEAGERPAILGDQTLWWIMNDRGGTHVAGTPVGLEVHAMAFAFDEPGDLGNTTFYKSTLFYKGSEPLDSAFVGLWLDPDLGDAGDDYVGSDTTLGMGYVYNADNDDSTAAGYGHAPPALGLDFFQSPVVPSIGDTALVSGNPIPDYRNLGMTTFMRTRYGFFYNPRTDKIREYNFMQGLWVDGSPIQEYGDGWGEAGNPPETKHMFAGDPVTNQFWSAVNSDGQGNSLEPGDKRFVVGSGPFTMNPGDRQEIIYGFVWARGSDNLDSITKLRAADALAQALVDNGFNLDGNVSTHELAPAEAQEGVRVYPNPVVGALHIERAGGFHDRVTVTVRDLLGRVVATAAVHGDDVRLDVSQLPAGRYFVRVKSTGGVTTGLFVKR